MHVQYLAVICPLSLSKHGLWRSEQPLSDWSTTHALLSDQTCAVEDALLVDLAGLEKQKEKQLLFVHRPQCVHTARKMQH